MSTLVVSRLVPDDWKEFRDLRLAALTDSPTAFSSTLAQQRALSERDWRQRLAQRTQFVVHANEIAVGTAGCADDGDGGAELIALWVHPNWRGQGVGDLLVQAVLACARDEGHAEIGLWVTEGNDPAEHLYARHGFVRTGKSQVMADRLRVEVTMRCRL